MNQFLIFRTDRIGDFLLTSILIKSIKNNPKSKITVICSEKNFEHIKNYSLVTIIFQILLKEFLFIFQLKKNRLFVMFRWKKRSIFASCLSNASKDFYSNKNSKLLFSNKNNVLLFEEFSSRIEEFKLILFKLNFNFSENDLNIFEKENISTNHNKLKSITNYKYNLLHLDEKWITEAYKSKKGIRNFKPINAKSDQILSFSKLN